MKLMLHRTLDLPKGYDRPVRGGVGPITFLKSISSDASAHRRTSALRAKSEKAPHVSGDLAKNLLDTSPRVLPKTGPFEEDHPPAVKS